MSTPAASKPDSSIDAITEFTFELTAAEHVVVGLSRQTECRVSLEEYIRPEPESSVEFFSSSGCSAQALRAWADRTDEVDRLLILREVTDGLVFSAARSGSTLVDTVEGAGAIPNAIRGETGVGRVTVRVPRHGDPQSVARELVETHPGMSLIARRHYDAATPLLRRTDIEQMVREELTERQWEVLLTALRHGYFERPRGCTGEELAARLDISSATFSQHLRAAQRNVFRGLLGLNVEGIGIP